MQEARRRVVTTTEHLSPWFQVSAAEDHGGDQVTLWLYQEHPGAAVAVPITSSGSILLSSEYRIAVDRVLWEVPGGRIDAGEAPEATALREMFEEIGAVSEQTVPLGAFFNSPGSSTEETHAFAALGARVVEPRAGTVERSVADLLATSATGCPCDASTLTAVLLAVSVGLVAIG